MENISKKNYFNILLGILLSILIFLCIFTLYGYFKNNSIPSAIKPLKVKIVEVNEINHTLSNILYDKNIKIDTLKPIFIENLSRLSKLKTEFQNYKIDSKYKSTLLHIEEGINNNILFFTQIQAIMNNPKSKDIEQSSMALSNYKDTCLKHYNDIALAKLNIKDSVTSINKSYESINNIVKAQRDSDISFSQNSDFIHNIEDILSRFMPLTEDMEPAIEKCRAGEYSFEVVLNDIDKSTLAFEDIRKEYLGLTVPLKCINTYNSLKEVMDIFELYLKDLRISVNNERIKTKDASLDKSTLASVYENPIGKFEDLQDSLERFNKIFGELKKEVTS
ncbi:hypothetical protein [Desnuesiella massiliensis]|uniref:hypothetical protein n=1 Tax=Desnuesiella massiliensis TaxID=1650662 RepID=UPI0006E24F7C|nr:hypothetical protein [Desnuesiella massiliensis]